MPDIESGPELGQAVGLKQLHRQEFVHPQWPGQRPGNEDCDGATGDERGRRLHRPRRPDCAGLTHGMSALAAANRASKHPRHRQRRHQHALVALGAQLRRQFVGDVPGEDDGAVGLILEHPAFFDDGDQRARHAFADLQRALDLADIVDDRRVESDVIDQCRGARGRADAANSTALFLDVADQRMQPVPSRASRRGESRRGACASRRRRGSCGAHLLDAGLHRSRTFARGVDADRAAMSRNFSRVKHLQPVHAKQIARLPTV